MHFTGILKSSFILFAAVLLASEGYGKPLKGGKLSSEYILGSIEASSEPDRDANATSVLRNEREAPSTEEYLKNYCAGLTPRSSGTSNPCAAGSYVCHGKVEIVCRPMSFSCLSSITNVGTPSCKPKYEWVRINLGSAGEKRVKRTTDCECA